MLCWYCFIIGPCGVRYYLVHHHLALLNALRRLRLSGLQTQCPAPRTPRGAGEEDGGMSSSPRGLAEATDLSR